MPNEQMAKLISEKLRTGITWPGDPKRKLPAKTLILPLKSGPGMPQQYADLIDELVKQLGESIVHLIETEGDTDLVPRNEHQRLVTMETRTGGGQPFTTAVPLVCRCSPEKPLALLTVTDNKRIVVDGRALISGFSRFEPACPHERKIDASTLD